MDSAGLARIAAVKPLDAEGMVCSVMHQHRLVYSQKIYVCMSIAQEHSVCIWPHAKFDHTTQCEASQNKSPTCETVKDQSSYELVHVANLAEISGVRRQGAESKIKPCTGCNMLCCKDGVS